MAFACYVILCHFKIMFGVIFFASLDFWHNLCNCISWHTFWITKCDVKPLISHAGEISLSYLCCGHHQFCLLNFPIKPILVTTFDPESQHLAVKNLEFCWFLFEKVTYLCRNVVYLQNINLAGLPNGPLFHTKSVF